ncbi:hypothetical protein F8S13_20305 [Chloroflexia bacterium SDU3-3]|nr:hypothetical protein F8S13_20305 [Chloroflexia bacterium SDU3-3]
MTTVADRIAELPPEKLALLLQRLKKQKAPSTSIPRIAREAASFPLSFTQQRQWFMEQLMPGAIYNVPQAIQITGALDVAAFERALAAIAQRHEALRTTFRVVDGQPAQVVADAPVGGAALPTIDLRGLPAAQRAAETARVAAEEAAHHFDLGAGPLWRTLLLQTGDQEHTLIITMHHIISDGWSIGVAMRELAALYTAFTQGREASLPELPIQYVDFAVWQRAWLDADAAGGSPVQRQLAYWREQLADAPALLALPYDRPRPAAQTYTGATAPFRLPRAAADALRAVCDAEGATMFMAVLAALDLALARYSGQDDICVGTPIANRTLPELEGLVGLFINTLVLRVRLAGDPSFRALLGQVRATALAAYANQDVPFERVVEAVEPERSPSFSPLFQALLVYTEAAAAQVELPGLTLRPLPLHSGTAQFDLSLYLSELEDGVQGYFEYNTDLFDEATVAQLAAHLQELIAQAAAAPDQPISALMAAIPAQKLDVVVVSAFTAEPLADSLEFWMDELHVPARIRFAPYSQVFQQLLDPQGMLAASREGVGVVVLRLEDWVQHIQGGEAELQAQLAQNVADFVDALAAAREAADAPCLVCVCPPSEAFAAQPGRAELLARLDAQIAAQCGQLPGVRHLHHQQMLARYPLEAIHDPRGDELGHIPYTTEFFAVLGTCIARELWALREDAQQG